jgi:hypothetical protein
MRSANFVKDSRLHSFGFDSDGEHDFFFVNYGPIDVTFSSWIVPGTICDTDDEGDEE